MLLIKELKYSVITNFLKLQKFFTEKNKYFNNMHVHVHYNYFDVIP